MNRTEQRGNENLQQVPQRTRREVLRDGVVLFTAIAAISPIIAACGGSERPSASKGVSIENGHFLINGKRKRFAGFDNYAAAVTLPQENTICEPTMDNSSRAQLIQNVREMGGNALRIWDNNAIDNGGRAMDDILSLAAPDIYILPSLTNQWGNCTGRGALTDDWYIKQEYLTDGFMSYLEWFTNKYKGNKQLLGIETVNEGQCSDPSALATFAEICYRGNGKNKGIKTIDPDRLVTIGTLGSGQSGTSEDQIEAVWRWADFGQVHIYPQTEPNEPGGGGYWGDQYNGVVAQLKRAQKLKKPLLVGEIGESLNSLSNPQHTVAQLKSKILGLETFESFGGILAWQLMLPQDIQQYNYDSRGFTKQSPMGQMYASIASQIINS